MPSPADNFTQGCHNYQCKAIQLHGEETEQVLVRFSWIPSKYAQKYILELNNSEAELVDSIWSLESSVTLLLPYGDYSATLCVVNRCGRACSNHSMSIPRPTPQPETTTGKIRSLYYYYYKPLLPH